MTPVRVLKLLVLVIGAVSLTLAFAAQATNKIQSNSSIQLSPTWSHPEDRYNLPMSDGDNSDNKFLPIEEKSFPIVDDRAHPAIGLRATVQTSPGIEICGGPLGGTSLDYQHNDNNQQQVSVLPSRYNGQYVHFAWAYWDVIPDPMDPVDRWVAYNCWSQSSGFGLGNCGFMIDFPSSGDPGWPHHGFPTVDVDANDLGYISTHARDEEEQLAPNHEGMHTPWVFNSGAACFVIFAEEQFGNYSAIEEGEVIWPHLRVDLRDAARSSQQPDDVFHLVAHPSGLGRDQSWQNQLVYWRRVGGFGNAWQGPVVLDNDAGTINHHVAVDPTSEKVAIFYQRDDFDPYHLLQNGYIESFDNGAIWIAAGSFPDPTQSASYVPITSYVGPEIVNPQSWVELQGEYDNDGIKHAVWIEQAYANATADCRLTHWDEINGARTIKKAIGWGNQGSDGARDLWLALPNLAFGDGRTTCTAGPGDQSNYDYVYVSYEQYGGPTPVEAADVSAKGYQNLEIYLSVSNDGGATFSPSYNLTKTKAPGCDGTIPGQECESERDPSLAHVVNDTIHIQYILDTDAGDVVFGQGDWTFNPVMYYRIPGGTDADVLCPNIAPVFAAQLTSQDPDCEYHAAYNPGAGPQQQVEDLIIDNFGNATLTGSVNENPPFDWLQLATGAYSVPAGSPPNIRTVTLNAASGSVQANGEGLYQSSIEITHNDTTQVSPYVIPVDFFVFDEFYCPEFVTMSTGWVWLTISNVERQANQSPGTGGLAKLDPSVGDSSYSIYDASLIIGRPPYEYDETPGLDTVVFRNIYGAGNGQPGFRALSSLEIDTSAYGTAAGFARAYARQTSVDSMLDIDVEYIFPQDPDSCEFVLINYTITNNSGSALSELAIGQATDFDVVPSRHNVDSIQPGVQNTGHIVPEYNLLYQQGADSLGHVVIGDRTATRFKAGITAIQCEPAPRGWIAPNEPWLYSSPGSGFHEGYLWQEMNKSGLELLPPNNPDPEEDLHSVILFDQDLFLPHEATRHYLMAYVTSNTGTDEYDLLNTTKKAWRYAFGWHDIVTLDSLPGYTTNKTWPYYAVGSHEDGLNGGCCGCLVTKVTGDPELTVGGGEPGGCTGTINLSGAQNNTTYSARFRVTDLCQIPQYYDDQVVTIVVGTPPNCDCPYQGDMDANGVHDAVDMNDLIDALFFNGPNPQDPLCPTTRGDFDADGCMDDVDLIHLIVELFYAGPPPIDPCGAPTEQRADSRPEARPLAIPSEEKAPSPPSPETNSSWMNRVVVESKSIAPGSSSTIGVFIENSELITGLVVPLVVREIDAGAFITSLNLVNPTPGCRGENSLSLLVVSQVYPEQDGLCGFRTSGSPNYVTPEGILLVRAVGEATNPPWAAGSDYDLGIPTFTLEVTVTTTEGAFVIDTTCVDPCNHLVFCSDVPARIIPEFEAGYINIGGCNCPYQCNFDLNSVLDIVDLNALIGILFFNAENPRDTGCPATRADFNYDGVPDAVDFNDLVRYLFFNGPLPCDPCNPMPGSCAP